MKGSSTDYWKLALVKAITQNKTKGLMLRKHLWKFLTLIIILGVLTAMELPCLLPPPGAGSRAEGRDKIRIINRAQEAYFLKNQRFASSFKELGVQIDGEQYYEVKILAKGIVIGKGIDNARYATKDYVSGISYEIDSKTFSTVICQPNNYDNNISNPSQAIINGGIVHRKDLELKCNFKNAELVH